MAAEPSASKKKKGSKGLPPGILEHRSGKLQARLLGVKVDGKAYQRPIPGLFKSEEEAVAAQAASMLLFESGGIEAVWPPKETAPDERNKRGQVRATSACSCTLPVLAPDTLLLCARVHLQGSKRKHLAAARLEASSTEPRAWSRPLACTRRPRAGSLGQEPQLHHQAGAAHPLARWPRDSPRASRDGAASTRPKKGAAGRAHPPQPWANVP